MPSALARTRPGTERLPVQLRHRADRLRQHRLSVAAPRLSRPALQHLSPRFRHRRWHFRHVSVVVVARRRSAGRRQRVRTRRMPGGYDSQRPSRGYERDSVQRARPAARRVSVGVERRRGADGAQVTAYGARSIHPSRVSRWVC